MNLNKTSATKNTKSTKKPNDFAALFVSFRGFRGLGLRFSYES